jgi:hypothetical protein
VYNECHHQTHSNCVMFHILFALFALFTYAESSWVKGATATYYGNGDGYPLEMGTCSCQKARDYNICYNNRCFETMNDPKMVAAINTPGMENTRLCGKCVKVRCVKGKNRGLVSSKHDWRDPCYDSKKTITVTITDSCPTIHPNPSNAVHCNYHMQSHIDLSFWAFTKLADKEFGIIDIEYKFVPCPLNSERVLGTKWSNCCDGKRRCVYGGY